LAGEESDGLLGFLLLFITEIITDNSIASKYPPAIFFPVPAVEKSKDHGPFTPDAIG
jgi:hypothetical protein